MNEKKQIKDLKERNNSLRNQLEYKTIRVEVLEARTKRLEDELENVKMHYETLAESKYYDFIDKHESKLRQRIDKAIDYNKKNIHSATLGRILKGE